MSPADLSTDPAGGRAPRPAQEAAALSTTTGVGIRGGSGALPDALAPVTAIRPGPRGDDEGGPGDTPASVAWLRAGKGTGYEAERDRLVPPALVGGRAIDPESGQV